MKMNIDELKDQLSNVLRTTYSVEQIEEYRAILDIIYANKNSPNVIEAFMAITEAVLDERVNTIVSRQSLTDIITKVSTLPPELLHSVSFFVLEKVQLRLTTFEEQVSRVREQLARYYEQQELWRDAADMLIGIPELESNAPATYKLDMYVKIARLLLKDNDPEQAEVFINRASLLHNEVTDDKLLVSFKICYAKVFDFRGRFPEAAHRYNELSYRSDLSDSDRIDFLRNAVICTILTAPGAAKSRLLTTLFKDERTHRMSSCFLIMKKMHLDHLIKPSEIADFERNDLLPHQKTIVPNDGTCPECTILGRVLLENNIIAIRKLYKNIGFDSLGRRLEIPAEQAEKFAAKMITEGRIEGSIDQTDNFIYFENSENDDDVLKEWDEHIEAISPLLNNAVRAVSSDPATGCRYKDFLTASVST